MKFVFIAKHRHIWPVAWLCEAMGVSRSGFHAWLNRSPSARSRSEEAVSLRVKASFLASDRTYGARRVWRDLLADGAEEGENARLPRPSRRVQPQPTLFASRNFHRCNSEPDVDDAVGRRCAAFASLALAGSANTLAKSCSIVSVGLNACCFSAISISLSYAAFESSAVTVDPTSTDVGSRLARFGYPLAMP
jgi:hypothetical protein